MMLLLLPSALAQETAPTGTFDAHGFVLAPLWSDPRSPLEMHRPLRFDAMGGWIGGVFEYASEPLLRSVLEDGKLTGTEPVVDDLVALNASVGWAPVNRLWIAASAPVYFASTGTGGVAQGLGLGDTRVEAMLELVRPAAVDPGDGGGFGLGLVPFVDIPTGTTEEFLGNTEVAGGGAVAATGEVGRVTLGAEVGAAFLPAIDLSNLSGSDVVLVGGHLGALLAPMWGVNLEVNGRLPMEASSLAGSGAPVEAILALRGRTREGAHVVLGGAAALTEGASAADFRVFLGGGWGSVADPPPPPPPPDTDGDGFADPQDKCPNEAETVNGREDEDGCPEAPEPVKIATTVSLDGKGVTGAAIELTSGGQRQSGTSAAAPWVALSPPGLSWAVRASYGPCLVGKAVVAAEEPVNTLDVSLLPVRTSGVTVSVVDKEGQPVPAPHVLLVSSAQGCVPEGDQPTNERIPTAAGNHTVRVWADGYREATVPVSVDPGQDQAVRVVLEPSQAKVTEKQIEILTPVFFDYNKDSIRPESFAVLDDVLYLLKSHPEILRVEVAGHTDADGSDRYNLDLSQRRVESVRRYLIEHGVGGERLVAQGYGEARPIAPNTTEDGKARNRRVEFNITERGGVLR